MAADSIPTVEEIKSWITPAAALARAKDAYGSEYDASFALGEKLKDGLLRSVATTAVKISYSREERFSNVLIPHGLWRQVSVWLTASVWKQQHEELFEGRDVRWRYHGILFCPQDLDAFLPGHVTVPQPASSEPLQPTTEAAPTKGPNLSAPALAAWYEAYKLAYPLAERTEDHAWDHAKRAFPDKTVTRASVRAILPPSRPGPRPKS